MAQVNLFNNSSGLILRNSQIRAYIDSSSNGKAEDRLKVLYETTSKDAAHYAARADPPSRCHPETRKTLLSSIREWLVDDSGSPVLWISGSAGMGKTTVAQTVCEEVQEEGHLAGDYFFCRSGRSDHRPLIVTLAYRLAIFDQCLKETILEQIEHNPAILSASLEIQLQHLIVYPMLQIKDASKPMLIVIDGLDECQGKTWQAHIVRTISAAIRNNDLRLRFLFTSRPEPTINDAFSTVKLLAPKSILHIRMEQDSEGYKDIRAYFETEFQRIRSENDECMDSETTWPSEADMDELVERSSGQFIYAATVIRFVEESGNPVDRLHALLHSNSNQSPRLPPLDRLYDQILSTGDDSQSTREVLGAAIFMFDGGKGNQEMRAHMLHIIELLRRLSPGGAHHALKHLHSVVQIPKKVPQQDSEKWPLFKFYHRSFTDFLLNASRSGEHHIDPVWANDMLANDCLDALQYPSEAQRLPSSRVAFLTYSYALQYGYLHIRNTGYNGNGSLIFRLLWFTFNESLFGWLKFSPHTQERKLWKHLFGARLLDIVNRMPHPSDEVLKERVSNYDHDLNSIRLCWVTIVKLWLWDQNDVNFLNVKHPWQLNMKMSFLEFCLPPNEKFKEGTGSASVNLDGPGIEQFELDNLDKLRSTRDNK